MPSRQSWSKAIGSSPSLDQPLVHDVEHLEKRHVLGLMSVARRSASNRPGSSGPVCRQTWSVRFIGARHLLVAPLRRAARTRSRAAPCAASGALALARELPGRRRRQNSSSSRFASPSAVWCSSRKWPPHDSSRSQRVEAHQLGELQEVGDAAGLLERLVQLGAAARARCTFCQNSSRSSGISSQRLLQARVGARHAAVVPHQLPSSRWNASTRALAA